MATQIMTTEELNRNIYLGKTDNIARPHLDDARVYADEAHLRRQQAMWDQAKQWADENA